MWVFLNSVEAVVMELVSWFITYSTAIIAFFNIILIYFIFLQLRDARKPLITIKIIPRDKEVIDKPNVLESGTTIYLAIINNSKNVARSINIRYQFNFNGRSKKVKEKKLSHLNPEEATKIVLKTKTIREECPEIFEEVKEGGITKIIPKETMKMDLIVTVSYNPLIGSLYRYKLEDNYEIEWGSLKNYPNFSDHPVFNCWNKRNGEYYIYKTAPSHPHTG